MNKNKNNGGPPSLTDVINLGHEQEFSPASILIRTNPSPLSGSPLSRVLMENPNPNHGDEQEEFSPAASRDNVTPTNNNNNNNPIPLALFLMQNPNPKPKRKRWKVSLEPRLRLDFTVIQVGPRKPAYPALIRSGLFCCMKSMFGGNVKIIIPESDIKWVGRPSYLRFFSSEPDPNPERRAIADGRAYFRDLSIVPQLAKLKQLPVSKIAELIRKTFSAIKVRVGGSGLYQFPATLPQYEVPSEMMYLVAKPFAGPIAPIQHPLTLVIKGLPLSWFANIYSDSDSDPDSDPMPALLYFFQRLASPNSTIRILDVSENDDASNVVVQFKDYGECYKVLKRLCSFSLLKVEYDGSKTRADYEIMWKDFM